MYLKAGPNQSGSRCDAHRCNIFETDATISSLATMHYHFWKK